MKNNIILFLLMVLIGLSLCVWLISRNIKPKTDVYKEETEFTLLGIFEEMTPIQYRYQLLFRNPGGWLSKSQSEGRHIPDLASANFITDLIMPDEQRHYGLIQLLRSCTISTSPRPYEVSHSKMWLTPEVNWLASPSLVASSSQLIQMTKEGTIKLSVLDHRMAVLELPNGHVIKGELNYNVFGLLLLLRNNEKSSN